MSTTDNQPTLCRRCHHALCVGRVPIFSTLRGEELHRIADLIVQKTFAPGELVELEGNPSVGLTIINSGQVKTYRYTPEGKEQILYIFSTGDFFGEMNLIRQQSLTYNVEALEETGVCTLRSEDWRQLMQQKPEILLKVAEELCVRLEKMENMVQALGSKDVDARVVMMLLEFSRKYGSKRPQGTLINLPLSREGLANYLGVTRETVSRKLHHLQETGIVKLIGNRKILVLDETALQRSE